jgi:hypothetical protein
MRFHYPCRGLCPMTDSELGLCRNAHLDASLVLVTVGWQFDEVRQSATPSRASASRFVSPSAVARWS